MTSNFRKSLVQLGMCGDLLLCAGTLLITAYPLYEPLVSDDSVQLTSPLRKLALTALLGICWHVSLITTGAYKSYRAARLRKQMIVLARGTLFAAFWAFGWIRLSFSELRLSPLAVLRQVLLFWIGSFFALAVTRFAVRILTQALRRRGRNLRNVLIVGSNQRAVTLADKLVHRPELGYRISGFIDDGWHDETAPEHYKQLLLGASGSFLDLLRNMAIDEVIIALPIASSYHFTQQIVDWCRQQGIPVRSEGNLFGGSRDELLNEDTPAELITHHEVRYAEWRVACKRLMDLIVSGVALTALLPLLIVIALAIKIGSPGPVMFGQERLGLNKRRFRIWKFRTMVIDAEARMAQVEHLNQSKGPTFKLKHDPRITRIGHFLRKTSLDELPQLFNVLLGDMSLVGPRPLPLRDYNGFNADWHRRRFSVKPGITCLWQITGRSSIGFDRWMELDMDYIDHWSLRLDLEILLKTLPAVLRGSGAM